uniref:Geminin DNA replication inhibitor n=1 Tax=Oreochromis niloticus TaxID=8128 RepID=I3JPD3_ORENI
KSVSATLLQLANKCQNRCSFHTSHNFSKTLLQVRQFNSDLGGAVNSGRNWTAEQIRGSKRVKMEVKSTQTEAADGLIDGMSKEAYELMVKETPTSTYWKEVAEEQQKALYNVLQENEKLHKSIDDRDEQITKLQSENEELQELAQHVQYMADMTERLTGKSPDNLDELRGIALDEDEGLIECSTDKILENRTAAVNTQNKTSECKLITSGGARSE